MLSSLASLYDPMGLLSPLTITGRILLQSTCKSGHHWDEKLDDRYSSRWSEWHHRANQVSEVEIPRHVKPLGFQTAEQELRTFADASEVGYGACSYLRSIDMHGKVHCTLMFGKSRVSPIKAITIPRLELQAALIAAKQQSLLLEELQLSCRSYLWTDSKIVLGYLNNDAKRFRTYVANRLSQIHDLCDKSQWHYVSTKSNPADLASRGVSDVDSLLSSVWFPGPSFLWNSRVVELETPGIDHFKVLVHDTELKSESVVHVASQLDQSQLVLDVCERLSSWSKATRIVAIVRKMIEYGHEFLRKKAHSLLSRITVEDISKASHDIIRATQLSYFRDEMASIQCNERLSKSSSLRKLDCLIDEHGVLRVGGRMNYSCQFTEQEKHPILIPKDSQIARLVISHYHVRCAHRGRTTTMSAVRLAGFWVVGLRALVSSHIYKCIICRRLRRPVEHHKMSDLPNDRLEAAAPFTYTGTDVFGPFTVTDRRSEIKRYGLIFTCLSSRAIHIEMLDDLTYDAFINSLRCFISLRGNVRLLRYDNSTNFVGADNELRAAYNGMIANSEVKDFFLKNCCEFEFNPPHASHFGGAWERLIRSVRNVLTGLLVHARTRLDSASLRTLLYECMAIVNSRPLTTIEEDFLPLTPNDLLHMKANIILPVPGNFDDADVYTRKRWKRVQTLAEAFWKRWLRENLHQLQARKKWQVTKRNMKVNDIVLVSDECSRMCWKLGKITDTITSEDGLVRRAKIQVYDSSAKKNVTKTRPVTKLVTLIEA